MPISSRVSAFVERRPDDRAYVWFALAIDPLKGRGFSRTTIEPKKAQDMTLWTETPAEVRPFEGVRLSY